MSFFAPRNEPAARRARRPVRGARAAARPEAGPPPVWDGATPAGYEPPAVTRWFEPAVTTEGAAPHWWEPCTVPTPLRCVRLGLLFDALVVPTPVALRTLRRLRGFRDTGPVADCATGKSYFLIPPGAAGGRPGRGAALRRLSTDAHLWLPSARPFREEPVWWLEPPRMDRPAHGEDPARGAGAVPGPASGGRAECPETGVHAVRLADPRVLVPALEESLAALAATS